ncbi:MAG: polysaccharide biosynthesis/export family protein, partial [candidate division WOR-3 bacterium]|nr:polysaccharide biosynthesis/export family protein [candidate division WOR-3 bacterium]
MSFLLLLSVLCSISIDDYIISEGDILLISVYGSVSFSYQQPVTSNGEIFIQYVSRAASEQPFEEAPLIAWEMLDVINIAGMSVKDGTRIVEERFKK